MTKSNKDKLFKITVTIIAICLLCYSLNIPQEVSIFIIGLVTGLSTHIK